MIIFIKIISIFLTAGAGLLRIGLEHRWHDKRTKKYKRIRFSLVILMIVGFLAALILVIYDDQQSEQQIQSLTDLKNGAEKAAKSAEKRELQAVEDRKRIKEELTELQEQIKPVVKLATEKYPDIDLKSALIKLSDDVKNLENLNEDLQNQTKELSARDYFYPLNLSVKTIVIERLSQIKNFLGNREIHIRVDWEVGNTKRQKVAKELVALLSECGFDASGPSPQRSMIMGDLPSVRIDFNPADENVAGDLAYALSPFLNTNFTAKKNCNNKEGRVGITIYGDPMFSENGVVTIP